MKKYIESISKLNQLALSTDSDEVTRFSESDIFWVNNKKGQYINRKIRKGDIFQFEFGKNYIPEMSYEHRGMVIGQSGRLLYVLPIFSYHSSKYQGKNTPCHFTDNPFGKSDYYLLKKSEFPFLKHDSIIKLNDIRTVSSLRIKYTQSSRISPESDTYKFIEKITFTKYFPNIAFDYTRLQNKEVELLEELEELKNQKEELQKELEDLKIEIQKCKTSEKKTTSLHK